MKLYYMPKACSFAPHVILQESGLPFTLECVDVISNKTETGSDFLTINPKGQVPALLLDEGLVLTEVVAILQYIADRVPQKNLVPPFGTLARYQAIESLNYIATEWHKNCLPFILGVIANIAMSSDYKQYLTQRFTTNYKYVNAILEKRAYLLGEEFSICDAYLFTMLGWTMNFVADFSNFPAIENYFQRIKQRPSVMAAYKAEGLAE